MFLQIVELKTNNATSSANPHSHDYYELYFQFEGLNRKLFIKGKMYDLPNKALCVIPPFCMHQLDGKSYRRINIDISKDLLSKEELSFLDECAQKVVLEIKPAHLTLLEPLLLECTQLYQSNDSQAKYYSLNIVKTILYFLKKYNLQTITPSNNSTRGVPDVIISKVILFLNENYQNRIDIKMLCDNFFLSKATLCARFKRMMKCSIMDYLLQLRLSKARDLLFATNQSIEFISETCGFSSTNYFRNVFKQIVGVPPLQYRKHMRGEQKNPKPPTPQIL